MVSRCQTGSRGLRPQKRSRVEIEESDEESEWSRLSGWKVWSLQDIAFGVMEIKGLLREQNGLLRKVSKVSRGTWEPVKRRLRILL